jgi:hypothetical protein
MSQYLDQTRSKKKKKKFLLYIYIEIERSIPIWDGQSFGLGTSDGDQQYVNGILKELVRLGPSMPGTGSKSKVFRNLLITSPSLQRQHVRPRFVGFKIRTCPYHVINLTTLYEI